MQTPVAKLGKRSPPKCHKSGTPQGTTLESATNDDWEHIRGAVWNDDPDCQLFSDTHDSNHSYTLGFDWALKFKSAEKEWNPNNLGFTRMKNVTGRSHYGDLQFLHCMASDRDEEPEVTKANIMTWMEVMYKLATGEDDKITPSTVVSQSPLGVLFPDDSLPPNWLSLAYLLSKDSKFKGLDIGRRALGSMFHVIQDSYAIGHAKRELLNEKDKVSDEKKLEGKKWEGDDGGYPSEAPLHNAYKGECDPQSHLMLVAQLRQGLFLSIPFTYNCRLPSQGYFTPLRHPLSTCFRNDFPFHTKMATIQINGNTANLANLPDSVPKDAESTNFILIQGHSDLTPGQKQKLEDSKVKILEYVSRNTYLCRYEPKDLSAIRAMAAVKSVIPYLPDLKTTVTLKELIERDNKKTRYEVDCILHKSPNVNANNLATSIAQKARVDLQDLQISPSIIRVTVHQDDLSEIAKLDSISRIEEVRPVGVLNNEARAILNVDLLTLSSSYEGANQRICVADTGFDLGRSNSEPGVEVHPALCGRVQHLDSVWPNDPKDRNFTFEKFMDEEGHGTHVCASICGSGIYTIKEPENGTVTIKVRGTAPAATLMVQSLMLYKPAGRYWKMETPLDLAAQLFKKPYDLGFRIHNNSWGKKWDNETGQLGYETQANAIDGFVYDHQDFIVLMAAGNNGEENEYKSQIGAAAAAKNCITVGSTGSTRQNDGQNFIKVQDVGNFGTQVNETAVFSSRGPTLRRSPHVDGADKTTPAVGRIKPDIVAPGVAVLSAASRALSAQSRKKNTWRISEDNDWIYASGTSMSTPLVAGCVALLREALQEGGKQNPSAALVKALLINGAVNYSESLGLGVGYDYEQGFGRVDVDSSIAMIRQSSFMEGGNAFEATQFDVPPLRQIPTAARRWVSPEIPVPSGRNRLVVSLAYPDPASIFGELQNDVNLATDNVEKIIWENVPGKTFKVVVSINNNLKPKDPAAFAVAWDIRPLARL
ncbi:uncharacterized protein CCOS01_11471 [Colletotrichum costaricense]|uniref:Peptidase S8/S53 domain-containing protein n=1 Tax=Colletotrichum costaricense TaxID=1209916 RepID=A0AAI9YPD5_9PEZI|nr:uncharacterized protein CCOS01_11471 [Colletotrichum costaricense]KAK1518651.1 hypothetical protein CCOS01_11471 [Colletotrichum costaricense]